MKLKPYPEYKDSGVEWIGEIPKDWKIKKLKHEFLLLDYKRIPLSAEFRGAMERRVYDYYGASGVIDKVEKYIFEGEFILVGEDGANLLSRSTPLAFIAKGKFWVNNHAHILKVVNGEIIYFANLLQSIDYTPFIEGSAQPKLTAENLKKITILSPLKSEQKLISNYLDKKTSKIDKTIEKDTQLIELLKEKRTALINHAVTKGLDPDTKMKDSGVEWIGKIPEGWELRKFSHICDKIVVGYVGSIESFYTDAEEGIPLLKTGNVDYGKINIENLNYVTKEFHLKNKKSQLKPGDIVIARHGESGRSSVIPPFLKEANCLNIVVLKSGKYMNGNYYSYLLNSHLIQEHLQAIQGGAVQGVVNTEDIAFLKVFYPSLKEQNQIFNYIDEKISKIDATIQKIEKKIELLEEYKKSLIHHVVTGKVNVLKED